MNKLFDIDNYKEIWQAISRNKGRSVLTGFGVAWGLFMFIIMSGFGYTFKDGIYSQFDYLPHNSLFIIPNSTTVAYKGMNEGRYWKMDMSDLAIIRNNVEDLDIASGLVFGPNNATIEKEGKSTSYPVRGVDYNYNLIEAFDVKYGRTLNPIDINEKRKVCLIGQKVYDYFFTLNEDPIGAYLSVNGHFFLVIGVMNGSDNVSINGKISDQVMIPYTTLQQLNGDGNEINLLAVSFKNNVDIKKASKEVKDILKSRHNIAPEDDEAFFSFDISALFNTFKNLFLGIDILIWIVGIGTMLAGAIGISNIMLVSIKERINEIGIKRAIGAKPQKIIRQILGESILLTFISGFAGLFLAVLILVVASSIISSSNPESMFANVQISFGLAVLSFAILLLSGLLAGFLPAKNAVQIKAIDALRDE